MSDHTIKLFQAYTVSADEQFLNQLESIIEAKMEQAVEKALSVYRPPGITLPDRRTEKATRLIPDTDLLTIPQFAAAANVHPATVRAYIRKGRINKVGNGKLTRVNRNQLPVFFAAKNNLPQEA